MLFFKKTRTFLSDPKLLNGSVYFKHKNVWNAVIPQGKAKAEAFVT